MQACYLLVTTWKPVITGAASAVAFSTAVKAGGTSMVRPRKSGKGTNIRYAPPTSSGARELPDPLRNEEEEEQKQK